MTGVRDHPAHRLTRHFFSGLFDLGFLSETGAGSFTRMVVGICAALLSFGLLLARIYMMKYAGLAASGTADEYLRAVVADHALLIALPMWIVAFVTVLIGHALFPDETDFRVLMAMPVTERLIFGSKLAALMLFVGVFVVATHVALAPVFLLTTLGPWDEPAFPIAAVAFLAASLAGCGFAVLAVVAIQGLLVFAAPLGRLQAMSAAVRSALLCGLVLALPLVAQLPAQSRAFADGAWWLTIAPPAWFVGVERLFVGDDRVHLTRLGAIAFAGLAVSAIAAAGFYWLLYHRFDRVMSRSGGSPGPESTAAARRRPRDLRRPVLVAVRRFATITLRRSVLHQGIVVALSAIGAGLLLSVFLEAGVVAWLGRRGAVPPQVRAAVVWAPFVMVFAMALAVRAALVVPLELRANWVFRVTEQDTSRVDQLSAAASALWRLGVVAPVALLLPLQTLVLGLGAVTAVLLTLVWGWLFVELLLRDWLRIPFTCSYLPGKRFVPQAILIGLGSFVLFTVTGMWVVGLGLVLPAFAGVAGTIGSGIAWWLRWRRLRAWRDATIEFEDSLPSEISALRLSVD